MDKRKDKITNFHIGEKFNLLTIQRFVHFTYTPSGRKIPVVWADCECGKGKAISLWDILSGKTKTCGFEHPHYFDRTIPALNSLYNYAYRIRATKAGIPFKLSINEFRDLTQLPCHYCGALPSNEILKPCNSKYIYNGLDRIVPEKGYVVGNVVPCCAICNHAKDNMSYDDFLEWIKRVSEFQRSKDNLIFVNGGVNVR